MSPPHGSVARQLFLGLIAAFAFFGVRPAQAQVVIYRFTLETERDFNRDSYDGGYFIAPFNGGSASFLLVDDGARTYTETASTGSLFAAVDGKGAIQWVVTGSSGGTSTSTDTNGDGTADTTTSTGTDTYLAFGPADGTETFHTPVVDISSRVAREMKGRVVGATNAVPANHPDRIGSATIQTWRLKFDEDRTKASNKAGHEVADSVVDVKTYLSSRGYLPEGTTALAITTASPITNVIVGSEKSVTLAATGGNGTYTWTLLSSSPAAAGVDVTSAGVATFTPQDTTTVTFTVRVTDSASPAQSVTKTFTAVPAVFAITTESSAITPREGASFSKALASNATGAVTWAVQSGSTLPAGLALSAAGVLSGTPTARGDYTFTIQATNSGSPAQTATQTFTITVSPPVLSVTPAAVAAGTVGTAYSQQMTATGGTAPYTWVADTALPAGLSISSSGLISGTPTAAGTTSISLTVTDAGTPAATGTVLRTLTVNN